MIAACRTVWRWLKDEDGNATIEFVIWWPFLIWFLSSAFEASLITTRQVMLNVALDRVVRDLTLGNLGAPSHEELKATLCNTAGTIPQCDESLHIEMERISTDSFAIRTGQAQCIDKSDDSAPALNFSNGSSNDLMLMTVCVNVRPIVPGTGLGFKLTGFGQSTHFNLYGYAAFVVEPA